MEYYDNNDSQYNPPPQGPSVNQPNKMAIASMICGIVGILLLCCCVMFPASVILGVTAIVLAVQSKKGEPLCGYGIAGIILGIFSLVLGIAEFAYMMLITSMMRDPQFAPIFDQIMEQYENAIQSR